MQSEPNRLWRISSTFLGCCVFVSGLLSQWSYLLDIENSDKPAIGLLSCGVGWLLIRSKK